MNYPSRLSATLMLMLAISLGAQAQFNNTGLNAAVFSGTTGNVTPSPSYDLVDATQFVGSGDLCQIIAGILATYNATTVNQGVLIDARGLSGSTLTCTSGDGNPWANLTGTFSSIVLLPSGTVTIGASWILPAQTQLIGEGPTSTIISAVAGMTGDMIDMGAPVGTQQFQCTSGTASDCPGIVIEHLGLHGNSTAPGGVNGIVNCCAQELSHVSDVAITNVRIALEIDASTSENSGPYSGLTISGVYQCLKIGLDSVTSTAPPNTRGVHGLSCSNAGAPAAIQVDGRNNTLEDIWISGTSGQDGILVGANAAAQGNVFTNIEGNGLTNVLHLSKQGTIVSPNNCPPNSGSHVCDITILGVTSSGGVTIEDDLTSTSILDSNVAMYVLGEELDGNATEYTRFTTATLTANAPTWLVGTAVPGTGTCVIGSLYSCTSSTCSNALWECKSTGTWKKLQ